jgi:hypothetical protein
MRFQTNIALTQSAADWLDTQALAIRKAQRIYISRSAFLRALVHGVQNGGLDFSHCRSEKDIAGYLWLVIRAFLDRSVGPELPMYTTEPAYSGEVVHPFRWKRSSVEEPDAGVRTS